MRHTRSRHPHTMAGWMLAALFPLTLAGCAEDGPASMIEAEPETFHTATVYEIVSVAGRLSQPGEQAVFVQFDSEEAKHVLAGLLAKDARSHLVALSVARAAQVWDNKRVVYLMGATAEGSLRPIHAYNYDPVAVQRALYGPKNRKPVQNEVPR